MSWAEATERAVLTTELLSRMLPQVNIQVGFKEKIKEVNREVRTQQNIKFLPANIN